MKKGDNISKYECPAISNTQLLSPCLEYFSFKMSISFFEFYLDFQTEHLTG